MTASVRLKVIILLCNQKWTNQGVNRKNNFNSEEKTGPFAANTHLINSFALTKTLRAS